MALANEKKRLIDELIKEGALKTQRIIAAFYKVDREHFVLSEHRNRAYANYPLPIYEGQTISQPLTTAVLTEAAAPRSGSNVLEIGAGSGYQAALLSVIVGKHGHVTTIERLHTLFNFAKRNLANYKNVSVIEDDGSRGYAPRMPYDCIIVSASAPRVPDPLLAQLKINGRLVITVGNELWLLTKKKRGIEKNFIGFYVFVPLIGEHGYKG